MCDIVGEIAMATHFPTAMIAIRYLVARAVLEGVVVRDNLARRFEEIQRSGVCVISERLKSCARRLVRVLLEP